MENLFTIALDPMGPASICEIAIVACIAYLNLPRFRYRREITEYATPLLEPYRLLRRPEIEVTTAYRAMLHYSGLHNESRANDFSWDTTAGRTYGKLFERHFDRRFITSALWANGTYIILAIVLNGFTWTAVAESFPSFLVSSLVGISVLMFVAVYFLCDPADEKGRINWGMLVPATILVTGLIALMYAPSVFDVSSFNAAWHDRVAQWLQVFVTLCMVASILSAASFVKYGDRVVDDAKKEIESYQDDLGIFRNEVVDEQSKAAQLAKPPKGTSD